MLEISDTATGVLTGSWIMHTRIESWRGEELLAVDVPVVSGTLTIDSGSNVPERVVFTVPRVDIGFSWDPTHEVDHPLAPYGQQIRVLIGVELGQDLIEWMQLGWFLLASTRVDGDTVEVEALGLLHIIAEARLTSPFQPTGTFLSTLRDLIEPALTADVTGLVNRNIPNIPAWEEDRLGGLSELLDSWPAVAYMTPEGLLAVVPDTDSALSVMDLTDGDNGTVVKWSGDTTRDDVYNMVVARGQKSDGTVVQGIARDEDPLSPSRYGGPFNQFPVPFFYFSPLLSTVAQCQAAAQTVLKRKKKQAAKRLQAEVVPNPSLQVRDRVTVTGAGLTEQACIIDSLQLPLTPTSGSMMLGLRVV